MDKAAKPSYFECYTPPSEPLTFKAKKIVKLVVYRHGGHSKESYEVGKILAEHVGDMLPNVRATRRGY
jgi:hypothetical protein